MSLDIHLYSIPHNAQRYPTAGDWMFCPATDWHAGYLDVLVSDVGNPDFEFLLALHELVEAYLCKKRGISQADVDDFDRLFEERRSTPDAEPGEHPDSPYFNEHAFATRIEKQMAAELNVSWEEYEASLSQLFTKESSK